VLELALGEALDLGHTYIGTEHLLLGLMRERDGLGAQVLLGSGIEFASVRQQIRQLLTGRREDDAPPPSERPAEPPGPSGDTTDDLTGRLASVAARLAVIELRLRDSAPGAGG
jgi:ATP-dependent Clp protease ATP-binding subunit ClpC